MGLAQIFNKLDNEVIVAQELANLLFISTNHNYYYSYLKFRFDECLGDSSKSRQKCP